MWGIQLPINLPTSRCCDFPLWNTWQIMAHWGVPLLGATKNKESSLGNHKSLRNNQELRPGC